MIQCVRSIPGEFSKRFNQVKTRKSIQVFPPLAITVNVNENENIKLLAANERSNHAKTEHFQKFGPKKA